MKKSDLIVGKKYLLRVENDEVLLREYPCFKDGVEGTLTSYSDGRYYDGVFLIPEIGYDMPFKLSEIFPLEESSQSVDTQAINLLERCLAELEKLPHGEVRMLIDDVHNYFGEVELEKLNGKG